MNEFYKIGEEITTPCDISYQRRMVRGGNEIFVRDKVFAGTVGVVREIVTFLHNTRLTVKFSGHRQTVNVVLHGEAHQANPLVVCASVSDEQGEAQNDSSEAPEESEARHILSYSIGVGEIAESPTTEEQDVPDSYDDSDVA